MSKATKVIGYVACVLLAGLVIAGYALFQGYFDPGHFEIKRFQWSSTNQVAMVAERWDDQALGGLEYYVLIGDHVFNATELRHAYYSNAVVFSALTDDDLALHWDGTNRLTIKCNGPTVDRGHINAQKQRIGNITISYENIALKEHNSKLTRSQM